MGSILEHSESGLISVQDLADLTQDRVDIKIFDASFVLPNSPNSPYQNFLAERIAGARFMDITEIVDTQSDLPNMLAPPDVFEKHMQALEIDRGDFVVVYGQTGLVMGPARAWWMLRTMGHENVAVLDGGLKAWRSAGLPLENGAVDAPPGPGDFKARYDENAVCGLETMKEISDKRSHTILDARPEERFSGIKAEPRPGMRSGHIPGSQNIPASALINPETGLMKSEDDLIAYFNNQDIYNFNDIICTCGSGVTACVIALALHRIGGQNTKVYDGSWSEWGHEDSQTTIESNK